MLKSFEQYEEVAGTEVNLVSTRDKEKKLRSNKKSALENEAEILVEKINDLKAKAVTSEDWEEISRKLEELNNLCEQSDEEERKREEERKAAIKEAIEYFEEKDKKNIDRAFKIIEDFNLYNSPDIRASGIKKSVEYLKEDDCYNYATKIIDELDLSYFSEIQEAGAKKAIEYLKSGEIEIAFKIMDKLGISDSLEIREAGLEKVIDCFKKGNNDIAFKTINKIKLSIDSPEIREGGVENAIDCLRKGDIKNAFKLIDGLDLSDSLEIKTVATEKAIEYFKENDDYESANKIVDKLQLSIDFSKVEKATITSLERAKEIMGHNFFGPEKVKERFNIDVDNVPEIPYTPKELNEAMEKGGSLVLRIDSDNDGKPLTIEIISDRIKNIVDEKSIADFKQEAFLTKEHPNLEWKIVAEDYICARGRNYFYGTLEIYRYLNSIDALTEKEKEEYPSEQEIVKYFDEQLNKQISFNWEDGNGYGDNNNWREISKQLEEWKLISIDVQQLNIFMIELWD